MSTYSVPSIATFFKVSKEQFHKDTCSDGEYERSDKILDQLILPARATVGSAGYDFFLPEDIEIGPVPQTIYTGVRVSLDVGWVLMLYPRSGLGFKYGMRLLNTTGIVDQDYFYADNEGHIAARVAADKTFSLKAGDRFMQGVLLPFGIAKNDYALKKQRTGGFGSTGGIQ